MCKLTKYGLIAVVVIILAFGCRDDDSKNDCKTGFDPTPVTDTITLDRGKGVTVGAGARFCGDPENYSFIWKLNEVEIEAENEYQFLGCPSKLGVNSVEVEFYEREKLLGDFTWRINVISANEVFPPCWDDAARTLRTGDLKGKVTDTDFIQAAECFENHLKIYPCSIDANYNAFFARFMVLAHTFIYQGPLFLIGGEQGLAKLSEVHLDPLLNNLRIVTSESDPNYRFYIDEFDFDLLDAIQFAGIPFWEIELNLAGEYDRADMLTLQALLETMKAAAMLGASYDGIIDLALSFLNYQRGLEMLDRNKQMMTLSGPDGEDGKKRMKLSQQALTNALKSLDLAFGALFAEIDDQQDDIIKYYDCGPDGICPPGLSIFPLGDPVEPFDDVAHGDQPANGHYDPGEDFEDLNGNYEWNDAWIEVGPDRGEMNGIYDGGEPIGVDAVLDEGRLMIFVPSYIRKVLKILAANVEGPGTLDIDAVAQAIGIVETDDGLTRLFNTLNLTLPNIRIWELFETPPELRNLLPLYSRNSWDFFVENEEEPFLDVGLDTLPDKCEGYYVEGFPDNLSDECTTEYHRNFDPVYNVGYGYQTTQVIGNQPYDPRLNKDPSRDNFRPLENPDDKFDNDKDGEIDEENIAGISTDFGYEFNFRFDYKDDNNNRRHDPSEDCEPFFDIGVTTGDQVIGKGNLKRDSHDLEHFWPTGDDVAGPKINLVSDPRNGTVYEAATGGLIDPIYIFLPDPSISGVIDFPEPTRNADGKHLTSNAEVHRIFSKIYRYYAEQSDLIFGKRAVEVPRVSYITQAPKQ